MNEILLRGCTLKNSKTVQGMVIYTGPETRIQQNSAAPPRKLGRSHNACVAAHRAVHHGCSPALHEPAQWRV